MDLFYALRKELQQMQDMTVQKMISGGCETYEDYRYAVGRVEAIRQMGDYVEELFEKAVDSQQS